MEDDLGRTDMKMRVKEIQFDDCTVIEEFREWRNSDGTRGMSALSMRVPRTASGEKGQRT